MGKNRDHEQLELLDEFVERGVIDDVLGVVKSGKEATVYRCRDGGGALLAAKVYRSTDVRRFSDDSAYRDGRLRRRNRYARAIEQKSRAGREFAFSAWVAAEYATIQLLHGAGADVPAPVARSEHVIVMEFVGDEDAPAAPLSAIRLGRDEAAQLFGRLLRNVELALACDRVHGDLSAFNVLYHQGDVRIIDFPQAVDPRFNHNALPLLERDVENLCGYFARCGVEADARRISRDLWSRFLRSEL